MKYVVNIGMLSDYDWRERTCTLELEAWQIDNLIATTAPHAQLEYIQTYGENHLYVCIREYREDSLLSFYIYPQ